jgi:hypothetical protein
MSLLRSLTTNSGRGGEIRTPGLVRPRHVPSTKLGHSPNPWWLVTELNRVHRLFRPALFRRVHEPKLVDGARVELAFHGCRPWVIPLYEPPIWGEMRESNSRDWSHNPVPKPFGQSRHRKSGAGRVNRTLVGEVQALCTSTVLGQQTLELARSLELRSDAYYRAPALPVELYQRSWRGDSNADHGLTRPALFPLNYTSANSGGGGENCTPDDLLCRQIPCCLGYATS